MGGTGGRRGTVVAPWYMSRVHHCLYTTVYTPLSAHHCLHTTTGTTTARTTTTTGYHHSQDHNTTGFTTDTGYNTTGFTTDTGYTTTGYTTTSEYTVNSKFSKSSKILRSSSNMSDFSEIHQICHIFIKTETPLTPKIDTINTQSSHKPV